MRSTWTILGLAASACLTLTPVYADSHGPAVVATPHAQVPQTTAHPTPASKPKCPRYAVAKCNRPRMLAPVGNWHR